MSLLHAAETCFGLLKLPPPTEHDPWESFYVTEDESDSRSETERMASARSRVEADMLAAEALAEERKMQGEAVAAQRKLMGDTIDGVLSQPVDLSVRMQLRTLIGSYQISARPTLDRIAAANLEAEVLALVERVAAAAAAAAVESSAADVPSESFEDCGSSSPAAVGNGAATARTGPPAPSARAQFIFSRQDVGRRVSIIGDDVIVDGKVRIADWKNARHRDVDDLMIVDVQERPKGLVCLEDKTSLQNPAPGLEQYTPGGAGIRSKILGRGF